MKFVEYDHAVIYAVLNDVKNYNIVGSKSMGWILLKGNKSIKIKKNV
jgi:hypothetical protein